MTVMDQPYCDILKMSTAERKYHLGLLLKKTQDAKVREQETPNKNAKGTRTTKISGTQLKNKIKSGEIK